MRSLWRNCLTCLKLFSTADPGHGIGSLECALTPYSSFDDNLLYTNATCLITYRVISLLQVHHFTNSWLKQTQWTQLILRIILRELLLYLLSILTQFSESTNRLYGEKYLIPLETKHKANILCFQVKPSTFNWLSSAQAACKEKLNVSGLSGTEVNSIMFMAV